MLGDIQLNIMSTKICQGIAECEVWLKFVN